MNSQGIPVGHFNIQEPDLTGSQYLANLDLAPEESEEELELSTFYQEGFQYEYSSDANLTWDTHYTDSYENPNEMTIEEKWKGSYYIHAVRQNGSYKLRNLSEKVLKVLVNTSL